MCENIHSAVFQSSVMSLSSDDFLESVKETLFAEVLNSVENKRTELLNKLGKFFNTIRIKGKENNITIDLGKMDNKPFEFEKYPQGENSFTFKLPSSGITLTYKLLTKKDENAIEQELAGMAKVTKDFTREVTTRLGHIITAVDGVTERVRIRKFVNEELPSKDSLKFRTHIRETMPDLDTTFDFSCTHCGLERKEETPMGVSFFWPNR